MHLPLPVAEYSTNFQSVRNTEEKTGFFFLFAIACCFRGDDVYYGHSFWRDVLSICGSSLLRLFEKIWDISIMTFTVKYRMPDGTTAEKVIEANDRSDCVVKCRGLNISPIHISQGSGTNDARRDVQNWHRHSLVSAVAIAAIIGVVAWFFLSQKKDSVEREVPRKAKAEIKTARPRTNAVPVAAASPKPEKKLPKWKYPVERTNELNEVELRKWRAMHRPPPGYTNTTSLTEAPPRYAIFKHRSENEIAALLTMTPGETLVGTPTYTKRFTDDFMKSLETSIVVSEEDSPEDAELKRAMVETKIDLKARLDAGEDLGQILLDTRREYQELARYKMMLQHEIAELRKNPDATIQDVEDFVTAANQLLEQKGIAPLKLSPISKRMLLRKKGNK